MDRVDHQVGVGRVCRGHDSLRLLEGGDPGCPGHELQMEIQPVCPAEFAQSRQAVHVQGLVGGIRRDENLRGAELPHRVEHRREVGRVVEPVELDVFDVEHGEPRVAQSRQRFPQHLRPHVHGKRPLARQSRHQPKAHRVVTRVRGKGDVIRRGQTDDGEVSERYPLLHLAARQLSKDSAWIDRCGVMTIEDVLPC